jgi:transcription elongation factor GreA
MDKIPMTRAGVEALEKELRLRIHETRPHIVAAISEARAHGDLSENAEYHAAKEQQSHNEGRIRELEAVIGAVDIIDPAQFAGQKTVKIARALIGKSEGDSVEVRSPKGAVKYEIVEVLFG